MRIANTGLIAKDDAGKLLLQKCQKRKTIKPPQQNNHP